MYSNYLLIKKDFLCHSRNISFNQECIKRTYLHFTYNLLIFGNKIFCVIEVCKSSELSLFENSVLGCFFIQNSQLHKIVLRSGLKKPENQLSWLINCLQLTILILNEKTLKWYIVSYKYFLALIFCSVVRVERRMKIIVN